jgi:hypothetical protein
MHRRKVDFRWIYAVELVAFLYRVTYLQVTHSPIPLFWKLHGLMVVNA